MEMIDIPNDIDENLFFLWEPWEAGIYFGTLFFGLVVFGRPIMTVIAIYIAFRVIRRITTAEPRGIIRHTLWWHGMYPLRAGGYKSGTVREIFGR